MKLNKKKIESHIVYIIQKLQKNGYETYLVGGAIRDLLLGKTPKDYDISTAATPEEVRNVFGRRKVRIIGKRFKLIHYYHGHEIIEISTFRQAPKQQKEDAPPRDNDYGTAEEDAWRRDFTVNAMFYDPTKDIIIDYTGKGKEDVKNSIVRVIGDPNERFEEDPVRLLRALKLVGQFNFTIEAETEKSLRSSLSLITHSSHSRLSLELEKIIRHTYSDKIFKAFYDYGFLAYYLPFMNEQWNSDECQQMLKLLGERNLRISQKLYRDSISLALSVAAYPFAENLFKNDEYESRGWEYFPGIEHQIKKILVKLFSPYHFPKRIISASVGTVLLVPSLLNMTRVNRTLTNRRYKHARELMIIQNNLRWKDPELEIFWPINGKRRKKESRTSPQVYKV